MDQELIQIQAFLKGISTHVDGGLGIRIETQELNSETKLKLLGLANKMGWFLFKATETPMTEEDIPKYDPDKFDEIKSPSMRMRAVLYKIWELDNLGYSDFETFYRARMEKMINKLKEKLN